MILLDNKMFNDGSFECYNFWIADEDGCYQVSHDDTLIQELKTAIVKRMSQGHSYLSVRSKEDGHKHLGLLVLEIQWG